MAGNHMLPVYPLFGVIGAAVILCGWYGSRLLTKHNDVVINKKNQMQFQDKESPKIVSRDATIEHWNKLAGKKE